MRSLVIIGMMLGAAATLGASRHTYRSAICGRRGARDMEVAVARARALGTEPWMQADRDRMKLAMISVTDVQPIISDSLCVRAAATIYRARPDSGIHVIYMVTFGKLYWATDPKLM